MRWSSIECSSWSKFHSIRFHLHPQTSRPSGKVIPAVSPILRAPRIVWMSRFFYCNLTSAYVPSNTGNAMLCKHCNTLEAIRNYFNYCMKPYWIPRRDLNKMLNKKLFNNSSFLLNIPSCKGIIPLSYGKNFEFSISFWKRWHEKWHRHVGLPVDIAP